MWQHTLEKETVFHHKKTSKQKKSSFLKNVNEKEIVYLGGNSQNFSRRILKFFFVNSGLKILILSRLKEVYPSMLVLSKVKIKRTYFLWTITP